MTHVLEVRLKGALLLGAGRSREIHEATLRRPKGEPYIPASALKGAIREQLVRLSTADDTRRILGGRGYSEDASPDENSPAAADPERLGGGYTRVYLGDADLSHADALRFHKGLGYTIRAQVSIDRQGRRAADRLLFQREVVGSRGNDLVFQAPVDASLLSPADLRLFAAAVEAVFAVGSSRSRGLGWVDLKLIPAAARPVTELSDAGEAAADLEVVFEALEPLSFGALPFVGNFQPTLDFLAASTVRGAVATAAMRRRGLPNDQSGDPEFRALLLDPDTCVRFGDAVPSRAGAAAGPRVAPLTVRVGKYRREEAGITDTLVRDYVQAVLADAGVFVAVADEIVNEDGQVERASRPGRWLNAEAPDRRVMTRLALEAESARGRDGALYSVELLERGTRFVAMVSNAGPEAFRLLADAAAADLRAGHGRSQGYGRLRIVEVRRRGVGPLRERLDAFDDYVRARFLAAAGSFGVQPANEAGRFVAALLVTELVPAPRAPAGGAEDAFHAALGLPGSRVLHGEVRAGQRGGFDTTKGYPRPFEPVVEAGSVLLLAVPAFNEATLARLATLERHGAGGARDRGFGAVRFSDPIHCKGDAA